MRPKMSILAAVAALLVAWIAMAGSEYAIILKNGSRLMAKGPPEIDGNKAIITLISGTLTSYRTDQIDFEATAKANKNKLGGRVIEELTVRSSPVPTPTVRPPLIGPTRLVVDNKKSRVATPTPTPTPTPGIGLQQMAYPERKIDQAFSEFFDDRKIFLYRTSRGTRPEYFFVRIVTDTEDQVFDTLQVVADGYAEICNLRPEIAPLALELEMVSSAGKPAGTFRITPEQAKALATKEISKTEFFTKHLIFN